MNPALDEWITLREAADEGRVTTRTLYNWEAKGLLKIRKVVGRSLVSRRELNELIAHSPRAPAGREAHDAPNSFPIPTGAKPAIYEREMTRADVLDLLNRLWEHMDRFADGDETGPNMHAQFCAEINSAIAWVNRGRP